MDKKTPSSGGGEFRTTIDAEGRVHDPNATLFSCNHGDPYVDSFPCHHCGKTIQGMEIAAITMWDQDCYRGWCRKCWDESDEALLEYQSSPLPTRTLRAV